MSEQLLRIGAEPFVLATMDIRPGGGLVFYMDKISDVADGMLTRQSVRLDDIAVMLWRAISGGYPVKTASDAARAVVAEIAAERVRQIEQKGYTADHDDGLADYDLIWAAATYAMGPRTYDRLADLSIDLWTFNEPPKFQEQRSNLVRAAALLVAAIERLDRKAAQDAGA